jgi:nitrite reductase/ring-hydroxylating ferredoxin subunit
MIPFARINPMESQESGAKAIQTQPPEKERLVVGWVEDVPPGRGATVELSNGSELALFNLGGEFFAIDNICPHKGAPLAEGQLCAHTIECPLHGWQFDVRTGRCLTTDADIESFEVEIIDGQITIII